nr:TPA_asm: L polymerase [Wuhan sharpbelly bornavirus]
MATHRTDQVLKSPLLGTEVSVALSGSRLPHHQRLISKLVGGYKLLDSKLYAKFFLSFSCMSSPLSLRSMLPVAKRLWMMTAGTWAADTALTNLVYQKLDMFYSNARLISTLEKHVVVQRLIQGVSFSQAESVSQVVGNLKFDFDQSLVLVTSHTRKEQCLMTYNHFLSFADTLRSRVHLLVAALAEDMLTKYPIQVLEYVVLLIDCMDESCLKLDHDTYFNTVKSIYPYSQGSVLKYHNLTVTDTSFVQVTESVRHTLPQRLLHAIDHLSKNHPIACLEIFSITKCFFFPEINLKEGAETQFTRMRREVTDSHLLSHYGTEVRNMFVKEYIRGYFKKHNHWPPVIISEEACKSILTAYEQSDLVPTRVHHNEYRHVTLDYQGKGLTFEPDLSDIVTDKAIIESKDHWTWEYNAHAYRIKHSESLIRNTETPGVKRLIIALLQGRLDNVEEKMDPFINGKVPARDLVTVLVPKEKELKVKGRFFSKQSCHIRLYQVLAELNVKKEIMPYIRTHSMTTGATQLSHILDRVAQQITSRNAFVINLDYETWCNTFRPEFQQPICDQFDRMFRSGCFFQTGCWMPAGTMFIMQDRFNPPRQGAYGLPVEDGQTCVHGALTMGEGMRQKLWTIMTGSMEQIVLDKLGLKGEVLGQGDNQTLIVQCPIGQDKTACKDLVLEELRKYALGCGLLLKPEECWASDVLYEYGKRMYFKGSPVSNFLKIFSRITDSTGEVYPNIFSRLSCLSSSCLSGAQADFTPWPSIISGIVVYTIEQHLLLPSEITSNIQLASAVAAVGPVLGGLPSPVTLPSVFYRGMADPLTFQLKLLKVALSQGLSSAYLHQVAKLQFQETPSAFALCVDPCCLNIIPLRRPERVLRTWIEDSLFEQTSSSRIMSLVRMEPVARAEALASTLMRMEPKFSRLMSYLFTRSNAAYGISILDKFQKSSTVIALSQTMNMRSIVEESKFFQEHIVSSILSPNTTRVNILDYLHDQCTFTAAEKLRRDSWKFPVPGATMPFIAEQFTLQRTATPDEVRSSIIFTVPTGVTPANLILRGSNPLYIGSRTFVKVTRGSITGLPIGKLGKMAEELVAVYDWLKLKDVGDSDGLVKVMNILLAEKGVQLPENPVVTGGTLTHRLPTASDDRAGLSGSMNTVSTHVRFTTDYMTNYSRSSKDFTIHFQAAFLHALNVMASTVHANCLDQGVYYLTICCPSCTREIGEEKFTLEGESLYSGIPLEMLPVQFTPINYTLTGDPVILASHMLGCEISESFSLESRGLSSLLDSGQSPGRLERLSLSHVACLPPRVVFCGIWYWACIHRRRHQAIKSHITAAGYVGTISPTLRWVVRWAGTLADQCSLSSLAGELCDEELLIVPGGNTRSILLSQMILAGFGLRNENAVRMLRRYNAETTHNYCQSAPPLDSLLGVVKQEVSTRKTIIPEVLCTNEYAKTPCHSHNAKLSLTHVNIGDEAQLLKAFIAKYSVELMVVSPKTPSLIVLDLCHVTKVVIDTKGDTTLLDKAYSLDSCGAVRLRLDSDLSLSTVRSALYYYVYGQPKPLSQSNALVVASLDEPRCVAPCGTTSLIGLYQGQELIDLSDMGCLPICSPCPALLPKRGSMLKATVKAVGSIITSIYQFGADYAPLRMDWGGDIGSDRGGTHITDMIKQLHQLLELVRPAVGRPRRGKVKYYLRQVKWPLTTGYLVSLRPPGSYLWVGGDGDPGLGCLYPDKSVDITLLSHLL